MGNLLTNYGEFFYFKGDTKYKLYIHCKMCKVRRFTKEEVEDLSYENLNYYDFIDKYMHYADSNKSICNSDECHSKLRKKGVYSNYLLLCAYPEYKDFMDDIDEMTDE